jgi:hypothetical protein
VLSVIGMLNIWPNFLFGISADSLSALFIGVVRGVVQNVTLYSILFFIVRFISLLYVGGINKISTLHVINDKKMKIKNVE